MMEFFEFIYTKLQFVEIKYDNKWHCKGYIGNLGLLSLFGLLSWGGSSSPNRPLHTSPSIEAFSFAVLSKVVVSIGSQ